MLSEMLDKLLNISADGSSKKSVWTPGGPRSDVTCSRGQ